MGLEKVRLSSWEALIRLWFRDRRVGRLASTNVDLKREDCLAGSALAGICREIGLTEWTGLDGRVKLSGRKASQSTSSVVG